METIAMNATTVDTDEAVILTIARTLVREKLFETHGGAPSKEDITETFKADPQGYRTSARRIIAALDRAGYRLPSASS